MVATVITSSNCHRYRILFIFVALVWVRTNFKRPANRVLSFRIFNSNSIYRNNMGKLTYYTVAVCNEPWGHYSYQLIVYSLFNISLSYILPSIVSLWYIGIHSVIKNKFFKYMEILFLRTVYTNFHCYSSLSDWNKITIIFFENKKEKRNWTKFIIFKFRN